MRAALCRRFQIDGVLVHYNRSCRPWCGTLQEVERRLRRELRLPIVAFEGDQGDPSVFSLSHFATRLDSLTELNRYTYRFFWASVQPLSLLKK